MPGQGAATVSGVRQGPLMPGTDPKITVSSPYATMPWQSKVMSVLPFLTMGIQGLGTLGTAFAQSSAQKGLSDYESSVYEANARLEALKATDAIIRGEKEAVKAKQAAKRLIGSQRAALGAQGIDIESGSALDIQEETASLGAEDALTIRNNAWREAWGYRVNEANYRSRAEISKITGKSAAKTTLLTGGLSALKDITYGMYLSRNKSAYNLTDYLSGVS